MRYVCSVCGFIYDEAQGIPSAGISPGTEWAQLPDDWRCPLCGASKSDFLPENVSEEKIAVTAELPEEDLRPMSPTEASALCSNLARGCEKQYQPKQAEAFMMLADFLKTQGDAVTDPSFESLLERIDQDLGSGYPAAHTVAERKGDRGALRSLVWSEKVTRMLKSLLTRYLQEGEKMLENTGVYVCTICGFVYVGNTPPERCPVCKVPRKKFEKIGGGGHE